MKLYIWDGDDTLCDYTSGMIAALGNDLEEALTAIRKACSHGMGSFPNDRPSRVIDLNSETKPEAWVCWGGG